MTPFLYLRSVTVYRELLREVQCSRAATALRRCSRPALSTGEFQILDLVPRQVMETLPSFNALIEVALGRCLNS